MSDLFKEVLSVVESEVTWLEDAAQHYESFGSSQRDSEKPLWELLTAVYRERAKFHQSLAEKMRSEGKLPHLNISSEQPTGLLSPAD